MVDGALSTLREVDLVLFLMDDMIEPGPGRPVHPGVVERSENAKIFGHQ